MSAQELKKLRLTPEYKSDGTYKVIVDYVISQEHILALTLSPARNAFLTQVTVNTLASPLAERAAWKACFRALMN